MPLKVYLWMMRLGVVMALLAFLFVIVEVDPAKAGTMGFLFFYGSLFLFLTGLFVQLFTFLRRKYFDPNDPFYHIGISFRQGMLLALLFVILLFMQSRGVLVWWDGLLIVVGIFFLEFYFLLNMHKRR